MRTWLAERLTERTTMLGLFAAAAVIAPVAEMPSAWAAGCLPLWLGLVKPMLGCMAAILVPNIALTGAPIPTNVQNMQTVAATSGQLETKPNA